MYCTCSYGRFHGKKIEDIPNKVCELWRDGGYEEKETVWWTDYSAK